MIVSRAVVACAGASENNNGSEKLALLSLPPPRTSITFFFLSKHIPTALGLLCARARGLRTHWASHCQRARL